MKSASVPTARVLLGLLAVMSLGRPAAGAPSAPRPIAPLSTATVTSRTPTLRWELSPGSDGARVELCRERSCASVAEAVDVAGDHVKLPHRLAPGMWFWRLTARAGGALTAAVGPVWQVHVGARSAATDTSFGAVLDLDGDGLADAAAAVTDAVVVMRGSRRGLVPARVQVRPPSPSVSSFGSPLACAGDLDGDGFVDLVVGALGSQAVYVYRGGPSGVSLRPSSTLTGLSFTFGESVAGVGDVDGDGYGDLVVGTRTDEVALYRGGASGLSGPAMLKGAAGSEFGTAVAGAGDVDGDGFADVIIGAPREDAAYLYRGGKSGLAAAPSAVLRGRAKSFFGCKVAGAGDVNGDGFADVIIAACGGAEAAVFLGGPGGLSSKPAFTLKAPDKTNARYVAGAGDVDGDGFADVLVGGTYSARSGAVTLYLGGRGKSLRELTMDDTGTVGFGPPMVGLGDVDGDGLADVLVHGGSTELFFFRGERDLAQGGSWDGPAMITVPLPRGVNLQGYLVGASF